MEYEIYKGPDELYHWGIKGMRWGQRRYQNKDGSLTPAGQKRYKAEMAKLKAEEEVLKKRKATAAKLARLENKRKSIEDQKKALDGDDDNEAAPATKAKTKGKKSEGVGIKEIEKQANKPLRDMTDDELINAINRARLEDTYRQLRPEAEKHPLMKKVLNDVVMPAAIDSGKKLVGNLMTNLVEKATGSKVDENSIEALTKVRDKLKLKAEINNYKNHPDNGLNWENETKKENLQEKKADVDAQTRGYDSAKAERKAKADNDARSRGYNNAAQEAQAKAEKQYSDSLAKKAEQEAKAAEKQAKKDAKAAEKQAKKDAKAAEKQAKKDAKDVEITAPDTESTINAARRAMDEASRKSGETFVNSTITTIAKPTESAVNSGRDFVDNWGRITDWRTYNFPEDDWGDD